MAAEGIKNFAIRVRVFLIGIVLILLVTSLLNGLLIRRTLQDLRDQIESQIRIRAERVLADIGPDRLRGELERWHRSPSELPRIEVRASTLRKHDLLSIQILSPEGVVLVGNTTGELLGSTRLYELPEGSEAALRRGETVVFWPSGEGGRDDVVEAFVPILARDGEFLGTARVSHDASLIRARLREYRTAIWAQAAAIGLLLFLTFAFSRWLVRPLRLVERTTSGEDLPAGEQDPTHFLLDTYRKMIGDLRAKEEELRMLRGEDRRRARLLQDLNRTIVESLLDGILVIGSDGSVREVNRNAARILGLPREEGRGRDYRMVLEGWPEILDAVAACASSGAEMRHREVRGPGGGTGAWVELNVSRLRGEEGGVLVLVGDLTEVKAMEGRMKRREMLADLGELSAGIAHEFRNALATVLGYTRLISRRGEAGPEVRAIEEEVHSLERVVRDFLRFADPTRLVLCDMDLGGLLRGVAGEVARPGVEVRIAGNLPTIRGDETLLRRTFRNLLRNAVESVPAGRPGHVEVVGRTDGGKVTVEIRDDGEGIASEDRERLFQPFFTTKPGGTGLGLALVQKIVLSHNGDIRYEPRPGGGTVFKVTLPVQETAVPAS